MHTNFIQNLRLHHTLLWTIAASALVVMTAAGLARATLNMAAALTEKPDLAVYLLLEEEKPTNSVLLRESEKERDYLVETESGPKLAKLKKGEEKWYVSKVEDLRSE
jgi:hypothetical protein